jgi:pyruvate kinase
MYTIVQVRNEQRRVLAIMLDTKGPEIRTALLEGGADVTLSKGGTVVLDSDESIVGTKDRVGVRCVGFV